jgi:hypothetical protein
MTDDAKNQADEIAQLKKEVEELKATVSPKLQPTREEQERATAEWINEIHQMREGRMSLATPPSVVQYFADGVTPADCADLRQQAHRPTGRPGMIPDKQVSNVRGGNVAGSGTGWAHEIPLGPQPGIDLIDRGVNAALPHGPEWGKK